VTSVTVGPVRFDWQPDGQDAGTGQIVLTTTSGYRGATGFGVTRAEWNQFSKRASR